MKGSYTLLIQLDKDQTVHVGSLGEIQFKSGFYAYNGSAFGPGGLKRIDRHVKKSNENKNPHWHIDYLLIQDSSQIVETFKSGSDHECSLSNEMKEELRYIRNFGCSDCSCKSHLFYSVNKSEINKFLKDFYGVD